MSLSCFTQSYESLNDSIQDDDTNPSFLDLCVDSQQKSVEQAVIETIECMEFKEMYDLTELEYQVFVSGFGLDNEVERGYVERSKMFNESPAIIRRIESQAIYKIKKGLRQT